MCTAAMFIFFSVRFLNICKPRTTFYLPGWPNWIGILWKWVSMLTKLAGDGECRLAQFHVIRFLSNEIYHFFKAVPPNRFPFYLGSLLHIINFLFSHFFLFQNAILHKTLNQGFEILIPFFLRMQFSLVATYFSVVLVIYLRRFLHLKLQHEFFTFISFNIWRYQCKSIRSSCLELIT